MRDTSELPVAPTSAALPTGGTVRAITRWGTEVMHRRQRPVTAYDEELARLVADMVATMYAADGVGLAACQVGVDLAVFVFDCPDEDGVIHRGVVCNPEVALPVGRDRRLDDDDEGCLSYPGAFVECPRPDWARVTGTDASRPGGLLRGRRAARPLPPARDRPHPRHRLRRPGGGQGAQAAAQADGGRGRGLPRRLAGRAVAGRRRGLSPVAQPVRWPATVDSAATTRATAGGSGGWP